MYIFLDTFDAMLFYVSCCKVFDSCLSVCVYPIICLFMFIMHLITENSAWHVIGFSFGSILSYGSNEIGFLQLHMGGTFLALTDVPCPGHVPG